MAATASILEGLVEDVRTRCVAAASVNTRVICKSPVTGQFSAIWLTDFSRVLQGQDFKYVQMNFN